MKKRRSPSWFFDIDWKILPPDYAPADVQKWTDQECQLATIVINLKRILSKNASGKKHRRTPLSHILVYSLTDAFTVIPFKKLYRMRYIIRAALDLEECGVLPKNVNVNQ